MVADYYYLVNEITIAQPTETNETMNASEAPIVLIVSALSLNLSFIR
jgi:hypothetical protein